MSNDYTHRVIVGNGAAIDVELGYVPEFAMLINATDGDLITTYNRGKSIPFSSGGTTEVQAGDTITGVVTIATAASAAGDIDSCVPSALNVVTAGQAVNFTVTGGGAGGTPRVHLVMEILR